MKKRRISIDILCISMLVTVFMAYVIPCHHINDWQKSYGFPFTWFTIYHDTIGDSIMNSTSVSIFPLLANIVIFYAIVFHTKKLYDMLERKKDRKSIDESSQA